MRKVLLLAVLAITGLGCLLAVTPGVAENAPGTASPFKGRIVAASWKGDTTRSVLLDSPKLQQIGGRSFIVGTGVNFGQGGWMSGHLVWVPIDDLSNLVEFSSVEEFQESRKSKEHRETLEEPQATG